MLPWTVRTLLLLPLLLPLSRAAPRDGVTRMDTEVLNPFQRGPEQLRFLQSHLKGLGKSLQQEPESLSWEQVLLCMIAIYDYDRNGQLDGLELMAMMPVVLAQGTTSSLASSPVVLAVDKVLETKDLDGDGLVTPAELINGPGQPRQQAQPWDAGGQTLLAEDSPEPEAQEALRPQEQVGGEAGVGRESLEPLPEAVGLGEAGEAPGPTQEAWVQAEAQGESLHHVGEVWVEAEALGVREEAEEPPGETVDSLLGVQEQEANDIMVENVVENDEM